MSEVNSENTLESLGEDLVRTVIHMFYEDKEMVLIDTVIQHDRITEKQLVKTLMWDLRTVKTTVAALRADKILTQERIADVESRLISVYYYINYKDLVNVVKYKLDGMKSRLNVLERDLSKKPTFSCVPCGKSWTDIEAGELFNQDTLEFHCRFCRQLVTEDTSAVPTTDAHSLAAKFNEQFSPLYDIIRRIEAII